MNEEFVTQAITDDRCLKAHRLLERFEDELRSELTKFGEAMVETNPDLFSEEPPSNIKISWDSSTVVAMALDNIKLDLVNKDDRSENLSLIISLRWVDPLEWNEDDIDGALCAACYKINDGHRDDYAAVKEDTNKSEWGINFADDQFDNAHGILYIPVETAADFEAAMETLRDHFAEFGDYWGTDPAEPETGESTT